jgi:hypothetical protein
LPPPLIAAAAATATSERLRIGLDNVKHEEWMAVASPIEEERKIQLEKARVAAPPWIDYDEGVALAREFGLCGYLEVRPFSLAPLLSFSSSLSFWFVRSCVYQLTTC